MRQEKRKRMGVSYNFHMLFLFYLERKNSIIQLKNFKVLNKINFKNPSKSFHCFYKKNNYNYIIRYEEVLKHRLLHFCFSF